MGGTFVVGITDLVNGEKDPRNLMVVFSMLRVVMIEFDITGHVEVSILQFETVLANCLQTMFDSVFCYFPITFRPPPDDPYGITAQDLKDRLRSCIASTGDLAEYSFPALIDKLDSTSPNVKVGRLCSMSR
jgi:DNA repair/transcription protein MET18/MMS19